MILDLMQLIWDPGGIRESETAAIVVNSWQKRQLTTQFITNKGYAEQTRNVGGVACTTIETDFGRLNVMLERNMPADQVLVASLEDCAPRHLLIPNKGFLFIEALGKVGASEKHQIYGEIGLEYGSEIFHGKITNLTTS